ncbi:MAG TPA: hypothetical protein ENK35_03045 [Candidatus Tenderia sp.]|nr:hypothetical protein [Candidatus Tenderia sp.]
MPAIINAMQVLKRRGLAEIEKPGHYRITEDGRKHLVAQAAIRSGSHESKPRTVTKGLRKRAWWLIRKNKKVTLASLLSTLATGDEKSPESNIRKYLRQLTRAGYLTELKRRPGQAKTSNGFKTWLLINDPGPLPPVWRQKDKTIYDPNSGETIPLYKEAI